MENSHLLGSLTTYALWVSQIISVDLLSLKVIESLFWYICLEFKAGINSV